MITEPPIGIVVTWGKDLVIEKGGLLAFIRHFEKCMHEEGTLWLQRCKNKPRHDDLLYVYIIVCNRIAYRCLYAGWEPGGPVEINNGNGQSWSSRSVVTWPRLLLAGPVVKTPFKIKMKGFQGFRYLIKELF